MKVKHLCSPVMLMAIKLSDVVDDHCYLRYSLVTSVHSFLKARWIWASHGHSRAPFPELCQGHAYQKSAPKTCRRKPRCTIKRQNSACLCRYRKLIKLGAKLHVMRVRNTYPFSGTGFGAISTRPKSVTVIRSRTRQNLLWLNGRHWYSWSVNFASVY